MHYIEVHLEFTDQIYAEILEAELAEINFESFDRQGKKLLAYIQEPQYNSSAIDMILGEYSETIVKFDSKKIEHTNWNAVWESNYEPVLLENELFIGAAFHTIPAGVNHTIILEPNMSFGTGHHPTTEQVLKFMFDLDLSNKSMLDFGCGSAILSIYAAKKGAFGIGVEIDSHAAEAARHNLEVNDISTFKILTGGIETLNTEKYDIVAANINRNVIEESLEKFKALLKPQGWLLCSGFLTQDSESLIHQLKSIGFLIEKITSKEDWVMIAAKKLA